MNNLKKYNAKRNFNKTNEPIGLKKANNKKPIFVIQHHLASHDHYDLRLEYAGVLISFAVPKGPSYNPKVKRLAVHVENHPLSYANFEGIIPKGEYGGGTVMLFDKGYYQPLNNFKNGLKEGTLKFELHGKRLKGIWELIKFQNANWLLIKKKDEEPYLDIKNFTTSIKSGKTMEELASKKLKTSKKDAIVCGIKITNPNKIIFKNPKITKLDIALYYHKIARNMLPLIQNRLISTVRMPDGYQTAKFYKKHFPENPYLGKVIIKEKNNEKQDYYYIKNEQGLIYEVQMNGFEFHIWPSKLPNLNSPDLLVFDLDPDEKLSLNKVKEGVTDLKKILQEFNLKGYLKTSGHKGYHIMVPLNKKITWSKFSTLAKNIAELMEVRYPDKYTTNIRKVSRHHKIFIDWHRNLKYSTFVAPYSLRLQNKPTISMPCPWSKLKNTNPDSILITKFLK